jgi:uncharacterized protein YcgI (DUF1989 family)
MAKKVVNEFVVPAGKGKGFIVKKGQVLRVIDHVGPQVADIIFLNAHNYKEQFDAWWSAFLNSLQGIGGMRRISKLYSQPPWENVMLTVVDDPTGSHIFSGHCSRKVAELMPDLKPLGDRLCEDNFEDCLAEFGITLEDKVSLGVFDAFMNWTMDQEGNYTIIPPIAKKGAYIDFLAEMDVIVGFSNCPDQNQVNDYEVKDMKVQILE